MRLLVVVLLAALVARFERGRVSSRLGVVQRALEAREAPLVFGLVFGAIVWWTAFVNTGCGLISRNSRFPPVAAAVTARSRRTGLRRLAYQ